jgi:hypothetical protein
MFAILVVNLAWQPGSAWYLVTIVAHIAAPDIFRQRDAAISRPLWSRRFVTANDIVPEQMHGTMAVAVDPR